MSAPLIIFLSDHDLKLVLVRRMLRNGETA